MSLRGLSVFKHGDPALFHSLITRALISNCNVASKLHGVNATIIIFVFVM